MRTNNQYIIVTLFCTISTQSDTDTQHLRLTGSAQKYKSYKMKDKVTDVIHHVVEKYP